MRVKKNSEADLQQLITMCDTIGWDAGIAELEKIVRTNENMQVHFSERGDARKANQLGVIIVKQTLSISRLREIHRQRQLQTTPDPAAEPRKPGA